MPHPLLALTVILSLPAPTAIAWTPLTLGTGGVTPNAAPVVSNWRPSDAPMSMQVHGPAAADALAPAGRHPAEHTAGTDRQQSSTPAATAGTLPSQNQPAQTQPAQNQPAQGQPAQNQPAQNQPAQNQTTQNQTPPTQTPGQGQAGQGRQNTPAPAANAPPAESTRRTATPPPPLPRLTGVTPPTVALEDQVTATFDGLPPWLQANPGEISRIILFVDGRELTDVQARWGGENELIFTLARGSESRAAWAALLGRPGLTPRRVRVQVGLRNQPFPGSEMVLLDTLNGSFLAIAGVSFALLLATFGLIARHSDLLREGPIALGGAARRPFSLGRTQMAIWFFVVLASFLFIWIVTGSHDPLTPSVLALIGLSAGTALAAAAIDANKDAALDNRSTGLNDERLKLEADLAALAASRAALEDAIKAAVPDTDAAALRARLERAGAEYAAKVHRILQIDGELRAVALSVQPATSRGFWLDLLSDQNGVGFHRFQIVVWTLVLTIIFVRTVYESLAMPDFDEKLLALMGISSGTYLGFKFPEVK